MDALESQTRTPLPCGQRIIIVGPSCAGKTALAMRLAALINAPFVELDALYWLPGWTPPADDAFQRNVANAVRGDRWVVAGNYLRHLMPIAWPHAETIVWLDMPLRVTTWRVLRRSWRRWRTKELLWGTNRERFWQQFRLWNRDDSLIRFNIETHRRRRTLFEAAMADSQWTDITFVRLCSANAVRQYADGVERAVLQSRGPSLMPPVA